MMEKVGQQEYIIDLTQHPQEIEKQIKMRNAMSGKLRTQELRSMMIMDVDDSQLGKANMNRNENQLQDKEISNIKLKSRGGESSLATEIDSVRVILFPKYS